jgi:hypothetical protein
VTAAVAQETPDVPEIDRRLERLLEETEAATGPAAWPRVEALVTALVELYGRALRRLLDHARAASTDGGAALDARLERDPVVVGLLVLHDLHPVPVEARVERALARVASSTPSAARVLLVRVEGGTAFLRVEGTEHPPALALIVRAIELEAPELTGVQVAGLSTTEPPILPGFVPLERLRRRGDG